MVTKRLSKFVHSELPADSFRLLNLRDDEDVPGRLSFRLTTHNLANIPQFNAVSYVWGASDATHEVLCRHEHESGCCTFAVKPNLFKALPHLRDTSTRPLWIDAVCIDQANRVEKEQTIPLMGAFFGAAAEVLVWLGPTAHDSDFAIDILNWIWFPHRRRLLPIPPPLAHLPLSHALMQHDAPLEEVIIEAFRASHVFRNAFAALYRRDWFSRVWTFQEIMLAKDAKILCGDRVLPWAALFEMGDNFEVQYRILGAHIPDSIPGELNLLHEEENGGRCFWRYLNVSRKRSCGLKEDHVFGVLALASRNIRAGITVEYDEDDSRHYIKTCRQATVACLREASIVNLLADILLDAASFPKPEGLPSWCSDLTQRSAANLVPDSFKLNTSRDSGWLIDPEDENVLLILGQEVDQVKKVITSDPAIFYEVAQGTGGSADRILQWLARCEALANRTFGTEVMATDACRRTLSASWDDWAPEGLASHSAVRLDAVRLRLASLRDQESKPGSTVSEMDGLEDSIAPLQYMSYQWRGKLFFSTTGGTIGLANQTIAPGDKFVQLHGTQHYFVLNPELEHEDETYSLAGAAYVNGLMKDVDSALEGSVRLKQRTKMFRIC